MTSPLSFRSLARSAALAVAVVAVAATMVSCAPSGPRQVTSAEADRISETLFDNWDAQGSHFTVSVQLTDGSTLTLVGVVDFRNSAGDAVISSTGSGLGVTEVIWDTTKILERRPAFTALASATGRGDYEFVARAPDPTFFELDSLLAVVLGLSKATRDNSLLIEQDPGTQWLRSDQVAGVKVDVFGIGQRSRLWIETGTSRLVRFESNDAAGNRPIVVDLYDPGPQAIAIPSPSVVADAGAMRDVYVASGGSLPEPTVSPQPSTSP